MRKGNIAITMDHTVQFVQRGLDNLKGEAKASVVKPYASPLIMVVVPASPFDNHYPFRIFYTQSKEGMVNFRRMTLRYGCINVSVFSKAGSTPQEVAKAILSVVSRRAGLKLKEETK